LRHGLLEYGGFGIHARHGADPVYEFGAVLGDEQ
jgi:hypothetical protein